MTWEVDHSDPFGFADVNTKEDLAFAEWVLGDNYSLKKFINDSKELSVPLEKLIWMRFKEWKDDCKRKDAVPLPREEQGEEDTNL